MTSRQARVASRPAEIVREYAFEGVEHVAGVTHDGHHVWAATGSALLAFDPADGTVLERLELPAGTGVSGLESDGAGLFYCGGGRSGKVRAVRRPEKRPA